ncbi:MAG: DUF4186 domain-containing protein [Rouxiella aceris]|uniref:DUF4186 domain-containing protein n=1 Tax=Rouxiella aceris TaxID=2703884 RepID=UPI002844EFC1|nr:DUF4186 domain-containing protein [Rouxiella aceris]MDR3433876.1 DUF4186 domain-containing protein [Rouxiella aceris]
MFSTDEVFLRLAGSSFRQGFHLGRDEYLYCQNRGSEVVSQHAVDFIARRLAPAEPENDGKQTPMRGHPVFIAQHATATCCRGCLAKWHGIAPHVPVTQGQQEYIVAVILRWINQEMQRSLPPASRRATKKRADRRQQLDLF